MISADWIARWSGLDSTSASFTPARAAAASSASRTPSGESGMSRWPRTRPSLCQAVVPWRTRKTVVSAVIQNRFTRAGGPRHRSATGRRWGGGSAARWRRLAPPAARGAGGEVGVGCLHSRGVDLGSGAVALSLSPEHEAVRREVRAWIQEALPPDLKAKAEIDAPFDHDESTRWHKILHQRGWAAPHWPVEHGGPGLDPTSRFILTEELELAGTPQLSPFGLSMVGPLIMQFGTPAQKQRFLPRILAAEEIWCQ